MRLYFIRHGQSVTNLTNTITGQSDVALTEQGRQDAVRAGELLRGIDFDKVYASDLSRAVDTCRLALPDTEFETTPLLREHSVGELAGKTHAECRALYGERFDRDHTALDFTSYGGEDPEMVRVRVRALLGMLEEAPYERVACFSHAGFIRTVLDVFANLNCREKTGPFACDNGSVSVFEIRGKHRAIVAWNYKGKLPDAPAVFHEL